MKYICISEKHFIFNIKSVNLQTDDVFDHITFLKKLAHCHSIFNKQKNNFYSVFLPQ